MKIKGIGATLKHWRTKVLDMSLTEFATAVGSEKGTVSKYEADKLNVTLEILDQWERSLNTKKYRAVLIVSDFLARRYPRFRSIVLETLYDN